jgi:multidrug efflux pump subunit AcrB
MVLRRRWLFLPLFVLALSPSLLVPYYLGTDLYEDDEFSVLFVRVWMPEGSRIESSDAVLRQFEEAALALPREEILDVVTQVGRLDTESDRLIGKDVGQVVVNLVEPSERARSLDQIIEDLETRTSQITGYRNLEIATASSGPPIGKPVEVKIKGKDLDTLEEIAARVAAYLRGLPGVDSVQDDIKKGKQEVRIQVKKNRAHLVGLDASDIASQIKSAFDGLTATIFHDGAEEVDVVVKFQQSSRRNLQDIEYLKIPTRDGGLVPFDSVASYTVERGWADVKRFDGERAITVGADVDQNITTPVEVTEKLQTYFADIGRQFPGYRLDFRGEFKEYEEAFGNVLKLFAVGVLIMYLILAAQFRSYLQPLLVLFAVPFAFAGSMLCMLLLGYKFSINIMFGMVALAGIAVNDSIVLIAFINDARGRGASLHRAVLTAAKRRLRPIFLTTATTVFGLMPMALGVGGISVTWMPLANTIVWGLGVATFLVLVVIPPLYMALEDVRNLFMPRRRWVKDDRVVPVVEAESPRIRKVG